MIVTIKSYATEQISLRNPASGETIFLSPSEKCDVDEGFMLQADPRVRILKRHADPVETPAPVAVAKPVAPTPSQAPAAPSQASGPVSAKPSNSAL